MKPENVYGNVERAEPHSYPFQLDSGPSFLAHSPQHNCCGGDQITQPWSRKREKYLMYSTTNVSPIIWIWIIIQSKTFSSLSLSLCLSLFLSNIVPTTIPVRVSLRIFEYIHNLWIQKKRKRNRKNDFDSQTASRNGYTICSSLYTEGLRQSSAPCFLLHFFILWSIF